MIKTQKMAYSTTLLNKRVEIRSRKESSKTALGMTSGDWEAVGMAWAGVTWARGAKALREGALDAYDTVMIRMRWNALVSRDSRIVADGKVYEVDTMQADKMADTMQLLCHEVQI